MTPEARQRMVDGYAKLQEIMEDEELETVDPDIWYQTSRRGRTVARIPEGRSAVEVLIEAEIANIGLPPEHPNHKHWVEEIPRRVRERGEEDATRTFCSLYAGRPPYRETCQKELNHKSFLAFRAAGGETVSARFYARGAPQRAEARRLAEIALAERKANPPTQEVMEVVDTNVYCRTCGHLADTLDPAKKDSIKRWCTPCRDMRRHGWLT